MPASICAEDMAQTMRVLAGGNAVNAARHFTRRSYTLGDVASVTLWSRTMEALAVPSQPPRRPMQLTAEEVTQSRLVRERTAFKGVRYEDVDAATLALEEPPAIVVKTAQDWVGERFGFARPRKADLHAGSGSPDPSGRGRAFAA